MDKAAIGAIGERFGNFVSPERLKALPDLPSKFESERELRKSYREETGHKAPEGLAGFTKLARFTSTYFRCRNRRMFQRSFA